MHDGRPAMGTAVWLRRLGQLTDVGLHFIFAQRVTGAQGRVAGYGGGDGLLWRDQSQQPWRGGSHSVDELRPIGAGSIDRTGYGSRRQVWPFSGGQQVLQRLWYGL